MNIKHSSVCLNSSFVTFFLRYLVMLVLKFSLRKLIFMPSSIEPTGLNCTLISFISLFSSERLRTWYESDFPFPLQLLPELYFYLFHLVSTPKETPTQYYRKEGNTDIFIEQLGKAWLTPFLTLHFSLSKQVSHCSVFRSAYFQA